MSEARLRVPIVSMLDLACQFSGLAVIQPGGRMRPYAGRRRYHSLIEALSSHSAKTAGRKL